MLSIFLTFQKARAANTDVGSQREENRRQSFIWRFKKEKKEKTAHGGESADERYLQREAAFLPGQRTSADCTELDD